MNFKHAAWLLVPLVALCSIASVAAGGDTSASPTLTVRVDGIRGTKGLLRVAVFNKADGWLENGKDVQGVSRKITATSMTFSFNRLKPGAYAVSVLHDLNENGQMDMRWLPWPKPLEGVAASRNPRPRAGPPTWKGSVFDLGREGKSITVKMYYAD